MKSERISMEMPIVVAGNDLLGTAFMIEGKTVVVSRQGGNIKIARMLAPHQEVSISCKETGKESDARVLGQLAQAEDGYTYSVEFLQAGSAPWGIEFPQPAEGEEAVGRVVLECGGCHIRELTYLDESQLEVLETNNSLARYCKRCVDYTVWKKSNVELGATEVPRVPVTTQPAKRTENLRRENRREVRVSTCIRSIEYGDDIVRSRNASRGGLCFESSRPYSKGWKIEVAIPYTKGGANIFLAAHIVRVQHDAAGDLNVCGVAYVK